MVTHHKSRRWVMQSHGILNISAIALAVGIALSGAGALAQTISVTGDVSPAGIGPGSTDIGTATDLFVGNVGVGTMSVIGGATFAGRNFLLGETASGDGTLTVSGVGSLANADGGLRVGRSGVGVLHILSGGTVSALGNGIITSIIAEGPGSHGTVNVDGGTLLVNRSDFTPILFVGYRSTGVLNVINGGRVTIGDAGSGIGVENGSQLTIGSANFTSGPVLPGNGTVLVSGVGSKIEFLGDNTVVNVGRMGAGTTGSLTINNGGTMNGSRTLNIGRGRENAARVTEVGLGATGTVIVDGVGSMLNIGGVATCCTDIGDGASVSVGRNDGVGTLTIRNGAQMKVDARGATAFTGGLNVARDALSTGTLTIESGGKLELLSDSNGAGFGMNVARAGTGTLHVTGGGQLVITNTGTAGGALNFGGTSAVTTGGTFSGVISGAGTAVTISGIDMSLRLGRSAGSNGTLTIDDGAVVAPGRRLNVGDGPGSSATLNVAGTGTTINIKSLAADEFGAGLSVGLGGTGIATISSGAAINVDGTLGAHRHVTNVGGTGTQAGGTGTLIISGAATRYNVTGATTSLVIGRDITEGVTPSTGTMTISDGAQVSFPINGTGSVGFTAGSSGTLHVIGAGSRLDMGAFLGVGRDYDNNPGGNGLLNVADGGVVKAASVHVGATATLMGNGIINGSVINDGTISPGTSPGKLAVSGDLTLTDSSVLMIEITGTGAGQYDVIAVGGALHLDGTLRVLRRGSYVPVVGDMLNILTFASHTGSFDNIEFDGFTGGAPLATSFAGGAFQVAAVPEPHEWVLMLAGILAVGMATRSRRSRSPHAIRP
jgi:T5SS/PEP-CTERM-associated repeat protein